MSEKNIYAALNKVMQEVGYVQKKRTQGLNYSYAGEAALIEATRPHLVAQEIVVHPVSIQNVHLSDYTTRNGAVMNRAVVEVVYRFAHAPSESHIDVPVTGEGADVGDKSVNKALTGAYKYALRQTLLIETGDDPDKAPSAPRSNGTTTTATKPGEMQKARAIVKAESKPKFNGNIVDARAGLDSEVNNGRVNLGMVADYLCMTGHYNDREHVRNTLDGDDFTDMREAGLSVDFRKTVTRDGGLKIFDKAITRKQA